MIRLPIYLASESIYTFDLDSNKLHISDYDVLWVTQSHDPMLSMIKMKKGTRIPYKIIRNPDDRIVGTFYFSNSTPISYDDVFHRIDAGELVDNCTKSNGMKAASNKSKESTSTELEIEISSDVSIEIGTTIIAQIIYTQSLPDVARGGELLFAGAVQPSDYTNIGKFFNIVGAKKIVRLSVVSAKKHECRMFDPVQANFFPQAVVADKLKPRSRNVADTELGHIFNYEKRLVFDDLIGDSRARYFALTARHL